jgi:predicted MFS family arabinose efflux permease
VLYAVSLVMGVLTVFFDLAALAYVPSLVGRDRIGAANAGMQVNNSIAQLAGPGLGGLLIQAIGAARAIAVDSLSYVVSVASLLAIRNVQESLHARPEQGSSVIGELREGIAFVFGHPILRPLILVMGLIIMGGHLEAPNLYPYAYQHLLISPAALGWIFSAGGAAAMLGALVSRPVIHRVGTGWSLTLTGVASGLAWLPLLVTPRELAVPVLLAIFTVNGFANPINNLAQWSQRQAVTPDRLQGRMSSVFRTVYWGIWPLGELAGGYAGSIIGPLPVIVGAGVMFALFSCLALVTPLRRARV